MIRSQGGGSQGREAQQGKTPSRAAGRSFRPFTLTQALTAGGIVIGVLAVASPSWAGPMMGC